MLITLTDASANEQLHFFTYCDDTAALERTTLALVLHPEHYTAYFGSSSSKYIYPADLARGLYQSRTNKRNEFELESMFE